MLSFTMSCWTLNIFESMEWTEYSSVLYVMYFTGMCTVIIISLFTHTGVGCTRNFSDEILHVLDMIVSYATSLQFCYLHNIRTLFIIVQRPGFGATFVWHTLQCCSAVTTNTCKLVLPYMEKCLWGKTFVVFTVFQSTVNFSGESWPCQSAT